MAKKPTEFTPGLFGFDVPVDKGTHLSENKKPKTWESDENDNPMVLAYGRHQDKDLRCRDCDHLFFKQFAKKYFKCSHRGNTGGEATDHRKHWPACTKFEPVDTHKSHQIL
jgi:hypothetical protein